MSLLNFTINGKNSYDDFGWIIKSSNHETINQKRYESIEIPGRIGNLIIEDEGENNFVINLEVVTRLKGANARLYWDTVSKWLKGFEGYGHLNFHDGYQFEAILNGDIEITRLNCGGRNINLSFQVVPLDPSSSKYVLSDQTDKVLLTDDTKGIEVVN